MLALCTRHEGRVWPKEMQSPCTIALYSEIRCRPLCEWLSMRRQCCKIHLQTPSFGVPGSPYNLQHRMAVAQYSCSVHTSIGQMTLWPLTRGCGPAGAWGASIPSVCCASTTRTGGAT